MTEEKQFPFENLRVWKNSVELSNEIFEVIRGLKGEDEYELADQLKRSATSHEFFRLVRETNFLNAPSKSYI